MFKVQIAKDGLTPFHFEASADDLDLNDSADGSNFENVEIDGEIVYGGRAFNLKGTIKCQKSFICDRCLVPSIENQVHEFNEELESDDIVEGVADLTEMIRDTLLASQPIQNLCKEDCKGLCPICGQNLNEGDCKCDRFVVDPRLEALKNLLNDEDRSE